MDFILLLMYLSLPILVSSKKKAKRLDSDSDYSHEEKNLSPRFDFTGSLKQTFALQAIEHHGMESLVCSPLSALMPLGKLALGADGRSKSELLDIIGVGKKSKIKNTFRKLIKRLQYLPGVYLNVASRIYVSDKSHVNPEFATAARKIFQSDVEKLNYDDPDKASRAISKWIKDESQYTKLTSNRINIPITGKSAIMVNVIRFSGNWERKFHKVASKEFQSPSGIIKVPMMTSEGNYNYVKSDILQAQIIEIPYEKREASMIIVLPYSKTGLSLLLKKLKLAPNLLNQALDKLFGMGVILSLPKFRIETSLDLKEVYKNVGLHHVFTSHSGLTSIMHNEELAIGWAGQYSIIDVNEKGTDAASVSVVDSVPVMQILNKIVFNADHPFLFYVKVDKEQLFAGIYVGY